MKGKTTIEFCDLASAQFVRGGWLEEYVWHTVKDAGVRDARMGIKGIWQESRNSRNEFDVLACEHNQALPQNSWVHRAPT